MNTGNRLLCVTIFLLLALLGIGRPQQLSESKREHISVKGRIIGYSFLSTVRMLSGDIISLPHDEFLLMVEEGAKELEKVKYIKIRYKVTQQHHDNLPDALFRESRQRSFVLDRDEACDESAESFIRGDTFVSEESRVGEPIKFQNLNRLPGMEKIKVPEEGVLRCYSFEWDGIEK